MGIIARRLRSVVVLPVSVSGDMGAVERRGVFRLFVSSDDDVPPRFRGSHFRGGTGQRRHLIK